MALLWNRIKHEFRRPQPVDMELIQKDIERARKLELIATSDPMDNYANHLRLITADLNERSTLTAIEEIQVNRVAAMTWGILTEQEQQKYVDLAMTFIKKESETPSDVVDIKEHCARLKKLLRKKTKSKRIDKEAPRPVKNRRKQNKN